MKEDAVMRRILSGRRVAVVGVSQNPLRDSYSIAKWLQGAGYEVVPVNPNLTEWEGLPCYPTVDAVPGELHWVDVFLRKELVGEVVGACIRKGVKGIWMQVGVVDKTAAERARAAGIDVIMDKCSGIEWLRLHQ